MDESGPDELAGGDEFGGASARTPAGSYSYQWKRFASWCRARHKEAVPADPHAVATYLEERAKNRSRPSTLRVAAAAIARMHLDQGLDNPCGTEHVQSTLAWLTRNEKPSRPRVLPLDMDCYHAIRMTARRPRPGRGGNMEDERAARARGNLDLAMIGLMRDAMLRVREATGLRWGDLDRLADGTGRVTVQRLYHRGETDVRMVSFDTMELLSRMRGEPENHERIIDLSPNQIGLRIRAAAKQAGLGNGYSGESPRMGMIKDLETMGVLLLGEHIANRRPPWMDD